MQDIRDILFREISSENFRASITPELDGIICGLKKASETAQQLGVEWECALSDGDPVKAGVPFAFITGTPKQIAMAEEQLIGTLAKSSGIASAAARAAGLADGRIKIVSGAWKKMPPEIKQNVRAAVSAGGASFRIAEPPMVYMDKNFIRMLGSVADALKAASPLEGTKIVQIRGEHSSIAEETRQAIENGADILMVDTGNRDDLKICRDVLISSGTRDRHKLAFAGNLGFSDIPVLAAFGVDIVDIGKCIIDAPLLDMRLDVVNVCRKD